MNAMPTRLRRLARGAALLCLRTFPWLVTAGSVVLGTWFFNAVSPVVYGGSLAVWGVAVITARTILGLGAISAGAFALTDGLARRWFGAESARLQHARGLVALGGASMAVGTFIMFGRLAGFASAGSLAVAGIGGVLAALSAWSVVSLRRAAALQASQARPAITAPRPAPAEWRVEDISRERTPVT